jgi:hypothetical protein
MKWFKNLKTKIKKAIAKKMLKNVLNDIKDDLPEIKTEVIELLKVNGSELLDEIKETITEFVKAKIRRQRDDLSDK